jgi:predicted subunit of tRNA(5-methylaminomethyl-2-thiouridylate) methyltransferase
MKHLITAILVLLLTFSASAQSKEAKKVQELIDDLEQVLSLNKREKEKVYNILLEKKLKVSALKKVHKNDRETSKAEVKKLHTIYDEKLKQVLGKERMKDMFAFFKSIKQKKRQKRKLE